MKIQAFPSVLLALLSCNVAAASSDAPKAGEVKTSKIEVDSKKSDAEEARWLVGEGTWGTASFIGNLPSALKAGPDADEGTPETAILSYGVTGEGLLFFYLMGDDHDDSNVALTISEAALPPTKNFAKAACGKHGRLDPEDPRCAKITLTGSLKACPASKDDYDSNCRAGWDALLDKHPTMASWPEGHHFVVHELRLEDIWMIATFGGGSIIDPEDFQAATPKLHPFAGFGHGHHEHHTEEVEDDEDEDEDSHVLHLRKIYVPDNSKKVERSRWVVAHSLWCTISTVSTRLNGLAWGNIRSIVDGSSLADSTGLPVFYLPTPDPTNIDVEANPKVAITMSEAALAERLSVQDQLICDGRDPEDPLCARVVLYGTAVPITDDNKLKIIEGYFGQRHPFAPWLSKGGAHTGGNYYTIELDSVSILDYYGGATLVDVDDYLNWSSLDDRKMLRG